MTNVEHTKALAEKATPGPVHVEYAGDFGDKSAIIAGVLRERYGNNALNFGEDHATAEYVAHIWNTTPALAAAVERAQALHEHVTVNTVSYCRVCLTAYPCPTIEALKLETS